MRNRPGSEPRRTARAARLRPVFASIFAAACIAAGAAACAKASGPVMVLHPDSGPVRVRVELALTAQERSRGLMWRSEMDADAGMLFVFPDTKPRSFWMKNTPLALDIVYLDSIHRALRVYLRAHLGPPISGEACRWITTAAIRPLHNVRGWCLTSKKTT